MQATKSLARSVGHAHLGTMHRRNDGGSEAELRVALKSLGEAFNEFKKTNDERLDKLGKGQPDPLLRRQAGYNQPENDRVEGIKKRLKTF